MSVKMSMLLPHSTVRSSVYFTILSIPYRKKLRMATQISLELDVKSCRLLGRHLCTIPPYLRLLKFECCVQEYMQYKSGRMPNKRLIDACLRRNYSRDRRKSMLPPCIFCSVSCLTLLNQVACSIRTTWSIDFSLSISVAVSINAT